MHPRIDLTRHLHSGMGRAMLALSSDVGKSLDMRLFHLVEIRASQINGCAYCIDMHTKDARAAGETEQRIYALSAWRETPFFTDRERAALDWTEALTRIADTHAPDDLYERVSAQFDEAELVALTFGVVVINSWNRLAISVRIVPGTYQPAAGRPASPASPGAAGFGGIIRTSARGPRSRPSGREAAMITVAVLLLVLGSAGARGPGDIQSLLTSPTRHVRALSPILKRVVEHGVTGSPTFARLLADLNRTDVIVQIVATQNLRPSVAAQVLLVPHPRTIRFVRINMRPEGSDSELAALVAHELHHALEIAASPDVRDDRALARLYQRIGIGDGGEDEYETLEARETGRQVLRELTDRSAQRARRSTSPGS